MRQVHSHTIPQAWEYLGMNEWAVRWDLQIEPSPKEAAPAYVYQEEIFHEKPRYGLFVTAYIRNYYSLDEENALKSDMLVALLAPEDEKSKAILSQWDEFQKRRQAAKTYGRQLFSADSGQPVQAYDQ